MCEKCELILCLPKLLDLTLMKSLIVVPVPALICNVPMLALASLCGSFEKGRLSDQTLIPLTQLLVLLYVDGNLSSKAWVAT